MTANCTPRLRVTWSRGERRIPNAVMYVDGEKPACIPSATKFVTVTKRGIGSLLWRKG